MKKKQNLVRKKNWKRFLAIISIVATIGMFNMWLFTPKKLPTKTKLNNKESQKEIPNQTIVKDNEIKSPKLTIKKSVKLNVPFTPQAPFAVWDNLHNEACEEAALVMAKYWLNGEELTPQKTDKEILGAVKWQIDNWGGHYDLNVDNIIKLAKNYFGIKNIWADYNIDLEDIKKQLSKGNLVITPMAGRLLKNPYYRHPGPAYHMLVVIGYNNWKIITNDPGTRRGKDFKYSYSNFFESIHNWPFDLGVNENLSKDEKAIDVLAGQKVMIVVEKK